MEGAEETRRVLTGSPHEGMNPEPWSADITWEDLAEVREAALGNGQGSLMTPGTCRTTAKQNHYNRLSSENEGFFQNGEDLTKRD